MGVIDKLAKLFLGENDGNGSGNGTNFNEYILHSLVKRFKTELKNSSVRHQMIYPMTFTVVMHNDDYQNHIVHINLFIGQVVECFYEIILKYKTKYPIYINPAKYWTFRFIPCLTTEMELGGKSIPVQQGKIFILTSPLDITDEKFKGNNINVSLPIGKSAKLQEANINLDAFKNFVGIGQPIFIDWEDPSKPKNNVKQDMESNAGQAFVDASKKEEASKKNPFAGIAGWSGKGSSFMNVSHNSDNTPKLAYKLEGEVAYYYIKNDICWVAGNEGIQDKSDTFYVKSNKVMNPHLLIQKDNASGKYKVAAFGPAKMEEQDLPVSAKNNPKWIWLDQSVNINMNGFVVRFIKNN